MSEFTEVKGYKVNVQKLFKTVKLNLKYMCIHMFIYVYICTYIHTPFSIIYISTCNTVKSIKFKII